MKRVLLVALLALALPAAAAAKGASQATIEGPGLSEPIVLKSDSGGDPMLRERPKGRLGPRYRVTFVMPGPNGASSKIRQDLYPYAKPYLLSYTKPGQRFWDGQRTRGGWFQAAYDLKPTLVSAGLPATPPSSGGDGDGWLRWVAIAITIAAGLALLAALSLVVQRRRPRPATT